MIKSIRDPEKPNTLEELEVVTEKCVEVQELGEDEYLIIIRFSPTVPHCSLATLIGESMIEPVRVISAPVRRTTQNIPDNLFLRFMENLCRRRLQEEPHLKNES